ncbi:hypothetical protein T03_12974 [Trichinella britovi]|uniref:Uncharacterized protein n=1 Tax=Trichinella britovi TaxID=45882 RepID=A0A0V1D576_TRIBR|nr:hypothetical protein T03_12974 [Trichinella britovi]
MDGKMLLISLRPGVHLPGRFQRDLFDRSQPELLNLSTLHPTAFSHTFEHLQYFCLPARFNLYIPPTIPPNWIKSRNDLVQDVTQGHQP